MAIYEYPYTDFNEYNLDWIIKTCKNLVTEWAETKTEWGDMQTEWEDMQNYINNYFNNLDVSQEISDKIDKMVLNGTFQSIVAPFFAEAIAEVPTIVSDWIANNLMQETGYVIDSSLTVANAGADAKVTGDNIRDIYKNNLNIHTEKFYGTDNIDTGKLYSNTDGNKTSGAQWCCSSELIPIPTELMFVGCDNNDIYVTCFDENRTYISYVRARPKANSNVTRQITPIGTRFIGLSCNDNTLSSLKVEALLGSNIIEYPYDGDYYYFTEHYEQTGTISTNTSFDVIQTAIDENKLIYTNTRYAHNVSCFGGVSGNAYIGEATYTNIGKRSRIYTPLSGTKYVRYNILKSETNGTNQSVVFYTVTKTDKILAIGDSLTWIDDSNVTGLSANLAWGWQKNIERNGYMVDSKTENGGTITVSGDANSLYTAIVTNSFDVSSYDIIILFAGTNDVLYSEPLGSEPTTYYNNTWDSATFNGALYGLLEYIRTNNDSCKIIICTMVKSMATQRNYTLVKPYNDALKYACDFYGCYLLDLTKKLNVTPNTNNFSEFFYDNTHLNLDGMNRLGDIMLKAIEDC